MNLAELNWLATPEGAALLEATAQLPEERLGRIFWLRKRATEAQTAAVVALLALRRRAKSRYALAESMFFTKEGYEQATGEWVAQYHAARYPKTANILEICCGIGGDTMALLANRTVIAADWNPVHLACMRQNIALLPQEQRGDLHPICADATRLNFAAFRRKDVCHALFDPSRRITDATGERKRVRNAEDYSPPLSFIRTLCENIPSVAVKLSPALDESVLEAFPEAQVEFVSVAGECREATLWFGDLAKKDLRPLLASGSPYRSYAATLLRPNDAPLTFAPSNAGTPPLSPPRAFLYEPDPALIRAHLTNALAEMIEAYAIETGLPYLTTENECDTPFATGYRILNWMPFELKAIKRRLKEMGAQAETVKKRGVEIEPEEIRRRLLEKEPPANRVTLVVTRHAGKPIAMLCQRLPTAPTLSD